MARLQSIENALKEINATVFQELCDSFLSLRNDKYRAFSRIGSQTGKQKTVRGTPDSFFLLPNGNYLFVEITTDVSTKDKLANDIKACFDREKAKIAIEKIEEIILCFNFDIDQLKIEELNQLANSYKNGITVTYWSLDALSIELHLNHRNLVNKYLNLPLDTGQIVSIGQFIEEYNCAAQGIATPLDNKFLHRENEKNELKDALDNSDFIIVTGASGVGKTKLTLEVIKDFLQKNNNFDAYCVSYKSYTLLEDLYQYCDLDKNYLLFVDDANRIDVFEQIIGFYRTKRKGKLKVIITVRDYAYQEISLRCLELNSQTINIAKLDDQQIIDIIENDDFEIKNNTYQKKIVEIADGNPRIAIMASLLALKEQNIAALSDVSELFDRYFSTFIKDQDEFANKFNLKCLGIIAFFYTIPYKDRELTTSILENFELDYSEFIDAIDKLENLELVEIKFENVKISEQNLSTYFFYKSFIKDELLSFDILLAKYFDDNGYRFRDCVIPANNTFGSQKVLEKLRPKLRNYWQTIKENKDRSYKLLSTLWFYLQPETLEYIYNIIESIDCSDIPHNQVKYNVHKTISLKDENLNLLSDFFRFNNNLKDALELAFEYTKKCPNLFPELIYTIRKNLAFTSDDARFSFYRQSTLFDIIIEGLDTSNKFYSIIFCELSKTFLSYRFESTEYQKINQFTIYRYKIPNNKAIQNIREKIWKALDLHFQQFSVKALQVLKSYSAIKPDVVREIMEFDLTYLLRIIDKHLTSDSFQHCCYVQEQIGWCKGNKVYDSNFNYLTKKFTNSIYRMYLKIDWNRMRDKDSFEFNDHKKYNILKKAGIESSFLFKSIDDIKIFCNNLSVISKEFNNKWNCSKSLIIIINNNFRQNFNIGYQLLEFLIDTNIDSRYIISFEFLAHLDQQEKIDKIWNLIQSKDLVNKVECQLSFFYSISQNFITDIQTQQLLYVINNIETPVQIYFPDLAKYLKIDPYIFQKILRLIESINSRKNISIETSIDFFSNYFDHLGKDLEFIKRAYLQQDKIQLNFDYQGKGFLKILKQDPNFLIEYIENILDEDDSILLTNHREDRELGFIWKIDCIELQIIKVFDLVIAKDTYLGSFNHFCSIFFREVDAKYSSKVKKFIIKYVKNCNKNPKKINIIVDVVRYLNNGLYDQVLLYYISLNQDEKLFSKINWRSNETMIIENGNCGDIEAADWRKILSIVEKSNVGYRLIPIKKYLNDRIQSCLSDAEWHRKQNFLGKLPFV